MEFKKQRMVNKVRQWQTMAALQTASGIGMVRSKKGAVQKVQLAVVELVETTIFSAMVISTVGHYLLDIPFFGGGSRSHGKPDGAARRRDALKTTF